MQLFRSRRGFATNSSSTHSIILLKPGVKLRDTSDALRGEFGWQHFTAASWESKALYFACLLRDAANRMTPVPYLNGKYAEAREVMQEGANKLAREFITEVLGRVPEGIHFADRFDGASIDHQSVFELPATHRGDDLNLDFAKDLWAFVSRDDVAVLGGNDNGGDRHPDEDFGEPQRIGLPKDAHYDIRVRREPWGWSMFNRTTGTRLHLGPAVAGAPNADLGSYGSEPEGERDADGNMRVPGLKLEGYPDKSITPELVDVKITDFCPFGCSYCYQGSTPAGKHAKVEDVATIARELEKRQVWEVALGGGEPTMHPRFLEILQLFHDHNIVPNFTTRSTKWMEDPIRARRIMHLVGGVAFSVDTPADVQRFAAAIDASGLLMTKRGYGTSPFSFQYVLGTGDEHAFVDVVRAVKNADPHRLTLLGYKTTGRGNTLQPFEVNWAAVLKDLGMYEVSIDTALAQRSQRMLQHVDQRSYFTREGKHSCYIDAVAGQVGPSSYAPEQMRALHWSEWDAKDKKGKMFDDLWKGW